jgi:hypothetical protein
MPSSVADPGCLSRIPHPKTATKARGEKNLLSYLPFFVARNITKFYFIIELVKKIWANLQRIIELFTQTIVVKLSKV